MTIEPLLRALQDTGWATAIREGAVLFPWIECVHVLAIVTVVGTIAIIDLRLLGFASRKRGARRLISEVLPFTWGAFAFAVASGFAMFASKAVDYAADWPFRIKFILLLLAGANMLLFHLIPYRRIHIWDEMVRAPWEARVTGGASLTLWALIVVFGRWIGFTM